MLALLFLKHFIADFVIQNNEIAILKRKYTFLHHSYHHAVLTYIICLFFVPIPTALVLGLLDFVIHHNVDYIKSTLSRDLTPSDRKYWIYLGADQLLHSLTYLLIAYLAK